MAKILALDFGTKRVGYAVSDSDETMAFPRDFIAARPEEELLERIQKIVREERIGKIVMGLPLGKENEETAFSKKIRRFGTLLARTVMLSIEYIDEFHSTDEALSKIPLRKQRLEKGFRDAISAQVILQRYIDGK